MPLNYRLRKVTLQGLNAAGLRFNVIPNDAINLIRNAHALAVWVYLVTKPAGWEIRETDVCTSLGLNTDQFTAAMRFLHAVRLVFNDPDDHGSLLVSLVPEAAYHAIPGQYLDRGRDWTRKRPEQPAAESPAATSETAGKPSRLPAGSRRKKLPPAERPAS